MGPSVPLIHKLLLHCLFVSIVVAVKPDLWVFSSLLGDLFFLSEAFRMFSVSLMSLHTVPRVWVWFSLLPMPCDAFPSELSQLSSNRKSASSLLLQYRPPPLHLHFGTGVSILPPLGGSTLSCPESPFPETPVTGASPAGPVRVFISPSVLFLSIIPCSGTYLYFPPLVLFIIKFKS